MTRSQQISSRKKFDRAKVSVQLKDDMIFGKVPPQSREIEEVVLGAIMLEKNAFDAASELLKPESFYVDAHQLIFRAMQSLSLKYSPIDVMTVVEELMLKGDLDAVGGMHYVSGLTNSVVRATNIEAHSRIISQKFIQRELIRIGGEMIGEAYEETTDVFDLLDDTDSQLTDLISANVKKNYISLETGVMQSLDRIMELKSLDNHMTGIPTGFKQLDGLTHGWQETDLIILAARPSVGKTAFALNLARTAAGHFISQSEEEKKTNPQAKSKSVGFFSLEMSSGQLINRLISSETEIFLEKIMNGQVDDHEMKRIAKTSANVLSRLPVFIDDTASLNIFELRAKARRLKSKHNVGLIIIDYLQLMSGSSDRNGNREQEISKISRDLKGLAKELKVPIIALSQLSREVEKRKGEIKMPQLSDLRESGAIEQDADMVMFLYRPEYYEVKSDELGESTKGETHLKIAKHRNGSLEIIKLKANLSIQKFFDGEGEIARGPVSFSFPHGGRWKPISEVIDHSGSNGGDDDDEPF